MWNRFSFIFPHIAYYASQIHHLNIHSIGTMHPYRPLRPRRSHSLAILEHIA